MAARTQKVKEENFFEALSLLSAERGIPASELTEKIAKAIETGASVNVVASPAEDRTSVQLTWSAGL